MFALTPRLTLRPGWPEDAPALVRAIGHEAVARHLSRVLWPYTLDDARAFLALPSGAHDIRLQVRERSDGYGLVGGIGLHRDGETWELGYWLTPDAWGRGYATEAARAMLHIARHALGVERVVARHFTDNPASGRVLRKLGFVETGRGTLFSAARGEKAACLHLAADLSPGDRDDDATVRCVAGAMPMAA